MASPTVLIGPIHTIEGRLDPDPGEWLVIFKKGRGYKLYSQGSRRRNLGFNDFRGLKCARLRTTPFEVVITLTRVPLGRDLFLSTKVAATIKIDPEALSDQLLSALTEDADQFTRDTMNRIQVRLTDYVAGRLNGTDEYSLFRHGLQQSLFPNADGSFLSTDFLKVTTATVGDTEWPNSLLTRAAADDAAHAHADRLRMQNVELDLEILARRTRLTHELEERRATANLDRELAELAAASERGQRLLDATADRDIMTLQAEAERQIRLEDARRDAQIEMQKFANAHQLASQLGCSVRSLPGPWSELNDRTAELLNTALQSPHLSRRPEVLEAVMSLATGQEVGDRRIRRQAEQTIDAAYADGAQSSAFRRLMTEAETSTVLRRAQFTLDEEVVEHWRRHYPDASPLGASYCRYDDCVSVVIVDTIPRAIPLSFGAEVARTVGLGEFAKTTVSLTTAREVESALRDLFTQFTGGRVTVGFTAGIRDDGEAEVWARLSGTDEKCWKAHTKLTNPCNPWLLAVENIFANGKLRVEVDQDRKGSRL